MKVQVKQIFSRRRVMGSEKILPGVYDASAPMLYGLADELIELGFAETVADNTPETIEPVVQPKAKMQGITHEEFEQHTGRKPLPQAVEPVRSESANPTDVSPDSTPQPKARKRK